MSPRAIRLSLSRRDLFRSAAGTGAVLISGSGAFGASDFWNRKPASDWSVIEVETLTTKSPWARKVRGEISGVNRGGGGRESMDRNGSQGTFGGMSGADSNGIGNGGGGRTRGGGGGSTGLGGPAGAGEAQGPEVVIRWENAKPILEATKIPLPPDLENHYAISVTGLPPQILVMALNGRGRGRGGEEPAQETPSEDPAARQKALIDRLLRSATLSAKGHDAENADIVRQTADKQTLIFGFQKQSLPLTASDKDVQFMLKLGPLSVKTKFEPKEMMYKGETAL